MSRDPERPRANAVRNYPSTPGTWVVSAEIDTPGGGATLWAYAICARAVA